MNESPPKKEAHFLNTKIIPNKNINKKKDLNKKQKIIFIGYIKKTLADMMYLL